MELWCPNISKNPSMLLSRDISMEPIKLPGLKGVEQDSTICKQPRYKMNLESHRITKGRLKTKAMGFGQRQRY